MYQNVSTFKTVPVSLTVYGIGRVALVVELIRWHSGETVHSFVAQSLDALCGSLAETLLAERLSWTA